MSQPNPTRAAKAAWLTGRPRVQTKWIWGAHERVRWTVFALKFSIFLLLPWLSVGGRPALLFDIPQRQYHVFGQVFWPQDFYLLGLFLATAALMLFFSTALVARSWCGFACPQTLLTSLFMLIDHWVEGDRPARLTLDAGRGTPAAKARRALKHAIWLTISALLGFTFTAYIVGAHALVAQSATLTVSAPALILWAFITGITYLFAGHLRDWVCTTVCPYGRFQGAMQDDESLLVTYDMQRGEPRSKTKETILRGGCVDCGQCVTACPMGIDIRNGSQYECITCARCIDACDDTMDRVGAPRGLIRFASLRETEARLMALDPEATFPPATPVTLPKQRLWRPRIAWYAAVLLTLTGTLATLVVTRPLLAIEVSRDRTSALVQPDGRVSNLYRLKLLNKDTRTRWVIVETTTLTGQLLTGQNPIALPPGVIHNLAASFVPDQAVGPAPAAFTFRLLDPADGTVLDTVQATFVTPGATP